MQKTTTGLLLHPVFLASLAVLVLNDHSWKYSYHNWLTGKLSDFAGLIVLPVFLRALFPSHNKKIILFTALAFAWWKSPLSEPLLIIANQNFLVPLNRVVDSTDLIALAVLPLAGRLRPVHFRFNGLALPFLRSVVGVLAFLSLCSTSIGYRYGLRYGYRENRASFYESFTTTKTEAEILENLQRKGYVLLKDSIVYQPVTNAGGLYYRVARQTGSAVDWKPVPQSADSMVYLRKEVGLYYILPAVVFEGDTLKNVEFTINNRPGKKKRFSVWIESFETARPEKYTALKNKERKRLKKMFEGLLLNP